MANSRLKIRKKKRSELDYRKQHINSKSLELLQKEIVYQLERNVYNLSTRSTKKDSDFSTPFRNDAREFIRGIERERDFVGKMS